MDEEESGREGETFPQPTTTRPLSSTLGCVANVVNAIIGAGILGLPYAVARCGLLFGLSLLLFVGYLQTQGLIKLMASIRLSQVDSYEEVSFVLYGTSMRFFVRGCVFVQNYGAAVGYLRIIGDFMLDLLESASSPLWLSNRIVATALVAIPVVVPLSLPRNVSALDRMSFFCFAFSVSFCVAVFARYVWPFQGQALPHSDDPRMFEGSLLSVSAVSTLAFAYSCHTVAPPIFKDFRDATLPRMANVSRLAFGFTAVVYFLIALLGYLTFGTCVAGDLITSYHKKDPLLQLIRVILTASVAITYPLVMFPLRTLLQNCLHPTEPLSDSLHYGITVVTLVSSFLIAVSVPSLTVVFDFCGAVASPCVAFILPCMFYVKASKDRHVFVPTKELIESYIIFGAGIVFLVPSVWAYFVSLLDNSTVKGC